MKETRRLVELLWPSQRQREIPAGPSTTIPPARTIDDFLGGTDTFGINDTGTLLAATTAFSTPAAVTLLSTIHWAPAGAFQARTHGHQRVRSDRRALHDRQCHARLPPERRHLYHHRQDAFFDQSKKDSRAGKSPPLLAAE